MSAYKEFTCEKCGQVFQRKFVKVLLCYPCQQKQRHAAKAAYRYTKPGVKAKEVGEFIDTFWRSHFHPPSLRDICEGVGISSTSVASYHVKRLTEKRGDLVVSSISRGIVPAWVKQAIETANTPT